MSAAAGAVGFYLAMTGSRLKTPEDLIYAGLGTHFVPAKRLPELRQALSQQWQHNDDKRVAVQEAVDRIQPFTEHVRTLVSRVAHLAMRYSC